MIPVYAMALTQATKVVKVVAVQSEKEFRVIKIKILFSFFFPSFFLRGYFFKVLFPRTQKVIMIAN